MREGGLGGGKWPMGRKAETPAVFQRWNFQDFISRHVGGAMRILGVAGLAPGIWGCWALQWDNHLLKYTFS